ncbi:MAG TPA: Fe-Mn family superoxide dismutase [Xanthobacteraceae bacterium]|nr:Fe-Mn family superoxide dismutase [Xanthobacteraceae bacterium]
MAYQFLPLAYSYADLMPAMSEATARRHHDAVHGAYLDAVNGLLAPYPELSALSIEAVLSHPERLPDAIRAEARFQGGGHANHQFTWKILGAQRSTRPSGALAGKIDETFGGLAGFVRAFKAAALNLDGDGWAFLSLPMPRTSALEIVVTRGNDNVLELRKPGVLVCDLWRHAYADDHHGDRAAWIDAYLQVLDWTQCAIRYDRLVAGQPTP